MTLTTGSRDDACCVRYLREDGEVFHAFAVARRMYLRTLTRARRASYRAELIDEAKRVILETSGRTPARDAS